MQSPDRAHQGSCAPIAFAVVLPLLAFVLSGLWGTWKVVRGCRGSRTEGRQELVEASDRILRTCEAEDAAGSARALAGLGAASRLLARRGPLADGTTIAYTVRDPETRQESRARIRSLDLGGRQVPGDDTFVDQVGAETQCACTLFRRTEMGMLRVSSTVKDEQGRRAVGTCIPNTSPVTEALLAGKRYAGVGAVHGRRHHVLYEPLRGADGTILGALFVGLPVDPDGRARQAVLETRVRETGYAYVLDSQGAYIVSRDGERDGEDISQAEDADGRRFIQEMCDPGSEARGSGWIEYSWFDPRDRSPDRRLARLAYYEPWDWVIGVIVSERDLSGPVVANGLSACLWTAGATLGALAVGVLLAVSASRRARRRSP